MPTRNDDEAAAGGVRKAPTFGPEHSTDMAGESWCWWDIWFAVVAAIDHDGSLETLRDGYAARIDTLIVAVPRNAGPMLATSPIASPQPASRLLSLQAGSCVTNVSWHALATKSVPRRRGSDPGTSASDH